jgi:CheY-like chemotaxis protein
MALILAVEPDRRQASHITAVIRRLKAELVLAEDAAEALEALGTRLPDLILMSPLLSAQDEAALAARLRELGPGAAHVQELTIPILAHADARGRARRGVLSTLRRGRKQAATPDGCEPDVFAEQVSLYLERAAAERKSLEPDPSFVEPSFVEPSLVEPSLVEPQPKRVEAAAETVVEPHPELVAANTETVVEPLAVSTEPLDDHVTLELLLLPPTECAATATDEVEAEPVIAAGVEPSLAFDFESEPEIVAVFEEPLPVFEEPLPVFEEPLPVIRVAATVVPDEEMEPWVPIALDEDVDEPTPVTTNVWVLTPVIDIDEVLASVAPAHSEPEPIRIAAAPPPPPPSPPRKKEKPRKKPVQDEWGMFDPDQCGFAALVAKLDEITEEGTDQNADTTVRVIAY